MARGQQYVVFILPHGCDLTFGIVVDFYNQINLLYGAITEFCSPQSCPEMKATDEYDTTSLHTRQHIANKTQV